MQITVVENSTDQKDFLDLPNFIYKNDSNWVRPLDIEIENTFNPKVNPFFSFGKCERWLLKDNDNKVIGRIAAFINEKKAHNYTQPTGGMGFFECIENQEAAFILFDTAKEWLQEQGMKAMDGPINFGENDSFWGLLVDGFTPPSYGMNYNPAYYLPFFEAYGFKKEYEQLTNHVDLTIPFPERFTKIANWVISKPGYTFEAFSKKNIEKYTNDLMEIYNDAWKDFENFTPIKHETLIDSFKKMEAIMDEKLIWFAYLNGEPAAFVVIVPDANQMIKNLNGKLGLFEKIQFAYRRWKGVNRLRAIVMGTKSKYQKLGLESALFIKLKEYVIPKNQYHELELSWVGDFNEKMIAVHQATGATFGKKHLTMRKIF
ncbi:MAG: GNAT family N-acetyltransferase [Sphingobacteriaceae bacterium]|nr:GNAT family N-acetyltransferase [Sphingobacteriaceae bacterium]